MTQRNIFHSEKATLPSKSSLHIKDIGQRIERHIGLFWKVKFYLFLEEIKVIFRYYRSLRFFLFDLFFKIVYFPINPYRLCRKVGFVYGETPLTTWQQLAALACLTKDDVLLDLGCGRGRICFWSSFWIGCRAIGIDQVRPLIQRARLLSRLFKQGEFLTTGLGTAPLEQATVVYLYTFHPEEQDVPYSKLKPGARVITISEPLQKEGFSVISSATVSFPWGTTEAYVQIKHL